jgi:hypothetical protein
MSHHRMRNLMNHCIYSIRGFVSPNSWFDEKTTSVIALNEGEQYMDMMNDKRMDIFNKNQVSSEKDILYYCSDKNIKIIDSFSIGGKGTFETFTEVIFDAACH